MESNSSTNGERNKAFIKKDKKLPYAPPPLKKIDLYSLDIKVRTEVLNYFHNRSCKNSKKGQN